ncbi:peptidase S9 [Alishewanella longhuensis]|uniref:Peptidase S9 n=1 Tax=Alishewanella longhuensis TaxID=1091037 RepID=A0ABQ3KW25_9ALTE|nr:prolyl oligopeptidase family serine peptidase [Alishewanella longhuensis]GHG61842.1 peptidase S9 [Alishewanella longhuensis]
MRLFTFIGLMTILCCHVVKAATPTAIPEYASTEIPVSAFASDATADLLALSPDGSKIAMLQTYSKDDEQLVLVNLVNLATEQNKFLVKANRQELRIYALLWANNTQLLMKATYASNRGGVPVSESRLMVIDVETGEHRNVISNRLQRKMQRIPQFQSNIIALMPEDEQHLLLALDGLYDDSGVSAVKINLSTERFSVIASGRKNLIDWLADRQHQPRIAIFRDGAEYWISERLTGNKFRELWRFEAFSEQQIWPLGFDHEPNILYVSAYHDGRLAIFKVDLSDAALPLTLMKANEQYDLPETITYSWQDKEVIELGNVYVSEKHRVFQQSLDRALPDTHNRIVSQSYDENRYIVLASSETDAGSYLLGDKTTKSLEYLLPKYEQLPPEQMVAKTKIRYKARDGLTIEGFLSTPKAQPAGPIPSIIFPHGGPISFDNEDFDYWTQFFVNRGYAVLQMNFRGSAGYGFDFMQLGLRGWGLQMQDDVEDGTQWLVEQGIADANRICIVGASYGGYAALMGIVRSPARYKCAISFAGVTDVEALVRGSRHFTNYEIVKKQIGDDYRALRQRSPLTHAKAITIPVLLLHGDHDRSVPVQQSRSMFKALQEHNQQAQYIELEKGDHYLSTHNHRLIAFTAIEQFLKQHLSTQNKDQ